MPMTETCCEPRGSSAAGATEPIGDASSQRSQKLAVVGGILGAIAASSCCILPLALFSLGISGAWIGNLTALAPYQPYFIAATLACLGYGYWLVYRRKNVACAGGRGLRPAAAKPYRQGGPRPGNDPRRRRDCLRPVCPAPAELLRGIPMIKLLATAAFGFGLAASSSAFAAEKTITLAVQHMTCAACPRTVKASLQAVPGVTNVVVSAEDKTAVVTFDDSKAEVDALVKATTNAGYPSAPKS